MSIKMMVVTVDNLRTSRERTQHCLQNPMHKHVLMWLLGWYMYKLLVMYGVHT